jgi:FkbM family methyltransferase
LSDWPDRSLALRLLARLGHSRLRAVRARAVASGGLRAAALRRVETGTLRVPVGRAQGLRFEMRHLRVDHAHFGAIAHGLLEMSVQEAMARHLGRGGVLYDVGANVGFFSLLGARLVGEPGHVYAFEPAPENARAIADNAAMNAFANVTVLERAAFSRTGTGQLQLVDDRSWSKLEGYGAHPGTERVVDVELVAIDDLLAAGELLPPTLVKIDVEGAELEVLAGMCATIARHRPAIICELHGTHLGFVSAMAAHSYRVVNLEGPIPIETDLESPHALALPPLDGGD